MNAVQTSKQALFIICVGISFLAMPLMAQQEGGASAPISQTPDSFFQPSQERYYQEIPEAEGTAPGQEPAGADFWEPASDDFFDSLPRALDPTGLPSEDYDIDIWDEEFRSAMLEAAGPAEQEDWIRSRGYLEYRGIYSTNIDLSAPGRDADLRVDPNETEVNDWINGFFWGYEKEFAIVPDVSKGAIRYNGGHYNYADEPRENSTFHEIELASIQKLTSSLEWEIFGGIELDSREPGAQYYREDYFQWHLGTELRQSFDNGRYLAVGYQWRHRDYDTRRATIINTEETPFFDWHEHRAWGTYSHPLCDYLTFDFNMTFSRRDYESETLDAIGRRIPDTYRQYDSWEPLSALTATPTEHTKLTAYHRYQDLSSTGEFYDYTQHAFGLLYEQDLCPARVEGLKLISQFEYADRDYDAQQALPGLRTRNDERVMFYLAIERRLRDITTGVDFTYLDNDSNDRDSRYQEDRYGVYVRYDF
jgi:hypothetical protein